MLIYSTGNPVVLLVRINTNYDKKTTTLIKILGVGYFSVPLIFKYTDV